MLPVRALLTVDRRVTIRTEPDEIEDIELGLVVSEERIVLSSVPSRRSGGTALAVMVSGSSGREVGGDASGSGALVSW